MVACHLRAAKNGICRAIEHTYTFSQFETLYPYLPFIIRSSLLKIVILNSILVGCKHTCMVDVCMQKDGVINSEHVRIQGMMTSERGII